MDLLTLTDQDRIDLMEQAFSAVDEVCSQLDPTDWDNPTECPGWSVKDNLSHLVSFEARAVGREAAPKDIDVGHLPHVRDDFGTMNEREVEWRRARAGTEILDEFRDATGERLKQLAGLDEAGWDSEMNTPVGRMEQRGALSIRILDVFYHEQDIRRAVSKPGHLDGDVSKFVFEWMSTRALPRVTGKNAPDGSLVVYEVGARKLAVKTTDGRGAIVDDAMDPTVTFAMDLETYFRLIGGRATASQLEKESTLRITGDRAVAEAIIEHIVVVP